MPAAASFEFESASELPGSDRLSKYLFGAIRHAAPHLWDLRIEGREHIPTTGPAIITPNHLSFCDSVFVPAALPRRVWAIGKGEYMDSWKTKHLFPAMGMIPVDRSGGDAAKAALDTAARVLSNGLLFMIYPEGTRSRSGNLHKGRTGAARLAVRCNAPIVPVGHVGTVDVQPPDTFVMKPRKQVIVRFGAPMWAADFGDPDDPRTLRSLTDAVMFEIAQLSGQRYVDVYAGKDDVPDVVVAPKPSVGTAPAQVPSQIPSPVARPVTSRHDRAAQQVPRVGSPSSIARPPGRPLVAAHAQQSG
jgi:1-acyl-sn-glycerol-3-phosphate acyltransferase